MPSVGKIEPMRKGYNVYLQQVELDHRYLCGAWDGELFTFDGWERGVCIRGKEDRLRDQMLEILQNRDRRKHQDYADFMKLIDEAAEQMERSVSLFTELVEHSAEKPHWVNQLLSMHADRDLDAVCAEYCSKTKRIFNRYQKILFYLEKEISHE